jgi:thiamine biosynthesis protein ThiI
MEPLILARYGEIGLKGRNRIFFTDKLVANLAAQAGRPVGARAHFGRILIRVPRGVADDPDLLDRLRKTFGVVSISPALRVPSRIEDILRAADLVTGRYLERHGAAPITSFKVDTRRADKRFLHGSMEVSALVGRHLQDRYPLRVDLSAPDFTVSVEVRDQTYVYTEVLPGPGGLPVGTGGRVVTLLSGGIDSPVATWLAAKRGLNVIPVHFYAFPFVNERSKLKVLDLARVLAGYTGPLRVWVAFFTEIQRAVQTLIRGDLRVTVMRRMMMRVAERIASKEHALGIVTGESLGQVASQTLESIAAIESPTKLPVLRPLVGMDKTEIVAQARVIGTYDISVLPYEDCCSLFVPKHPRTHPRIEEVEVEEQALPIVLLVEESVERSELVDVSPGQGPVLLPAAAGV